MDFVELAMRIGIKVYAVHFDFPAQMCGRRVEKRSSHEGGLQGSKGWSVIRRFEHMFEKPTMSEGFENVATIQREEDVESMIAALSTWKRSDIAGGEIGITNDDGKMKIFFPPKLLSLERTFQ